MGNAIISEEVRHVLIDEADITYTLRKKNVKNFNLRITPYSVVIVSVPLAATAEEADAFVVRKKNYIIKALGDIRSLGEKEGQRQYISGESFRLEGKNLRLKVLQASKNSIESDGVFLILRVKDINDVNTKSKLVDKFLDETTRSVMNEVLDKFYEIFQKYDVDKPSLRVRTMNTRWGSCSANKGVITLNLRLIEAPRNCIEYVVMHELCHLIHPNHSKQFYAFLSIQMPDWKERKQSLDNYFYI